MLESPTRGISKDSHAKAFSRGFITVNNYFWFPPQLNLSPCFLDYLNFRCQGGEILLNLLTRKVSIEDEETYEDNKETEEKSPVKKTVMESTQASVETNVATTEQAGVDFINNLYGTNDIWKQTSYNTIGGVHQLGGTPFRKNFAGIGYTYDQTKNKINKISL